MGIIYLYPSPPTKVCINMFCSFVYYPWKLLIFSVNVVMYYISQCFFYKGINVWGEEILRLTKWKLQELKWKISFLKHLKKINFKLLFLLLKNVMWVFPLLCYKNLWINFFSFGDVNNLLVNSPSKKTLYFKDLKCVYFAR